MDLGRRREEYHHWVRTLSTSLSLGPALTFHVIAANTAGQSATGSERDRALAAAATTTGIPCLSRDMGYTKLASPRIRPKRCLTL